MTPCVTVVAHCDATQVRSRVRGKKAGRDPSPGRPVPPLATTQPAETGEGVTVVHHLTPTAPEPSRPRATPVGGAS